MLITTLTKQKEAPKRLSASENFNYLHYNTN
nr:MAG TPA: hypothetical protein [Caudoviricetes sp.]